MNLAVAAFGDGEVFLETTPDTRDALWDAFRSASPERHQQIMAGVAEKVGPGAVCPACLEPQFEGWGKCDIYFPTEGMVLAYLLCFSCSKQLGRSEAGDRELRNRAGKHIFDYRDARQAVERAEPPEMRLAVSVFGSLEHPLTVTAESQHETAERLRKLSAVEHTQIRREIVEKMAGGATCASCMKVSFGPWGRCGIYFPRSGTVIAYLLCSACDKTLGSTDDEWRVMGEKVMDQVLEWQKRHPEKFGADNGKENNGVSDTIVKVHGQPLAVSTRRHEPFPKGAVEMPILDPNSADLGRANPEWVRNLVDRTLYQLKWRERVVGTVRQTHVAGIIGNPMLSPRYAAQIRDLVLRGMVTNYPETIEKAVLLGGRNHGDPMSEVIYWRIFEAIANSRVCLWDQEVQHNALAGFESFLGEPVPQEAWDEAPEFWVQPLLSTHSMRPEAQEHNREGNLLDTSCELLGCVLWGMELTDEARAALETIDDPLYSNYLMHFAVIYSPVNPKFADLCARSYKAGRALELEDERDVLCYDKILRIRGCTYYSVGEPIQPAWAQTVVPCKLFRREPLVDERKDRLGLGSGRRKTAIKGGLHPPSVQVIQMRRAETPAGRQAGGGEPGKVEWTCRWPVRGHWVKRTKRTKTGEPVVYYQHGHIKGPADKPLRVPSEGIWHVLR
jgi:hypothetical protein